MAQKSTQLYLDIAEIKEDVVILKDGTLRAVLLCSSVNFALKSEDEQNALIQGYAEFLNSLEEPLQIVIQSRRLDIEGYIRRLKEAQKKQTNELLKNQIINYIEYILELVEIGEIMTKQFYIIVPYNPVGSKKKSFWSRLVEAFRQASVIKLKREKFLKYKSDLMLTVNNIRSGLKSIGLDTVLLDTQSLVEVYFNTYNPRTSLNQKVRDLGQIGVEE